MQRLGDLCEFIAEETLRLALVIRIRGVEEIDSPVNRRLEYRRSRLYVEMDDTRAVLGRKALCPESETRYLASVDRAVLHGSVPPLS